MCHGSLVVRLIAAVAVLAVLVVVVDLVIGDCGIGG